MIAIYGWRSTISAALRGVLPEGEAPVRGDLGTAPPAAERFVFACGLIRPRLMAEQTPEQQLEGWWANYEGIRRACETILAREPEARICIVGSESGYRGSYDGTYATAKAMMHHYVETRRLDSPDQQLVAVSPTIIGDAGMTLRREDIDRLQRRQAMLPKGRFLTSREVALTIRHLLYEAPYVSGTVVRMNGGEQ